MKRPHTLIADLAKNRVVEHLVAMITGRPASQMGDLVQMIYEVLLRLPPEKMRKIRRAGALPYYIGGIVRNLYFSKTSPYYRKIRRQDLHDNVPQD